MSYIVLLIREHFLGGNSVEEQIQAFMEDNFLFEFGDEIVKDTDLFKAGILDSFGYVQLFRFLEKEFDFKFTEEELLLSVSVTFDSIVERVRSKTASGTEA